MSTEIGECVLQFTADTKSLDTKLAKIQRAIQAMRDVLNEDEAPARSTRDSNDVLVR